MKKIFCIIVSIILCVMLLISCNKQIVENNDTSNIVSNEEKIKYKILEGTQYDNVSGAPHKQEIELRFAETSEPEKYSTKELNIEGKDVIGTYLHTRNHYYYKTDEIVYRENSDNGMVNFGISADTGELTRYSWVDKTYADSKNGFAKKNRDDCMNIAKSFLSEKVSDSKIMF